MGKFLNGLCIGIGIGLLIAPETGEETRRLVMERVAALRKSLSSEDDEHFAIDAPLSQVTTLPVEPAQPTAISASEPQEEDTTTIPLPEISPALSDQIVTPTDNIQVVTDTEQSPSSMANPPFAPDTNPDEQTSAEMPITDTENSATLSHPSTPSNTPGRISKRKASTRTPNTGKTRGHNKP